MTPSSGRHGHQLNIRRWRGNIDVPMTPQGVLGAHDLGSDIRRAGGLDFVYHDKLQRCRHTAEHICDITVEHFGPRPWDMGPTFEGNPITEDSLVEARRLILTDDVPPGGEPFSDWYNDWMTFLCVQEYTWANEGKKVGIVTHNRNIQAVYASDGWQFHYPMYDCEGPAFLSVHFLQGKHIAPWGGKRMPPGLYLIRHGETSFGT